MPGTTINLYFVRHGQRIDQVDFSWAGTSPCPQDPPLTEQGKHQARQTGKIIRDFAHESRSSGSSFSTSSATSLGTTAATAMESGPQHWTLQRITPPDSPSLNRFCLDTHEHQSTMCSTSQGGAHGDIPSLETHQTGCNSNLGGTGRRRSSENRRKHHFAIVTSPFLRCSQTAIEMAIGMRMASPSSIGEKELDAKKLGGEVDGDDRDLVTVSVESGLAGKYLALPVPDSIIVQRMQDFALSRRDHEQYYSIDWKYSAKERQLPNWPETREEMQTRLEQTLAHILAAYTGPAAKVKDKDRDLSIVFVTHASPVNALLEACLQMPVLVPVPNCSISRCRWTPSSTMEDEWPLSGHTANGTNKDYEPVLLDALMQSRLTQIVAQEEGRWLLDYQTYTAHLDRDLRR
ncbi:hypothetical protein BGZ54_006874 [Gamsiella multidivaricata]|nr:hypothetical protein BGZ54_006874 [Gamsiella multidivaricata]